MFPEPTVFVLGAGASVNYGLPLGDKLKSEIIATLRRREQLWVRAVPADRAEEFAQALEQMDSPIDDWLSRNDQNDLQLGKYMIAGVIATKETDNLVDGGWYMSLWTHLVRRVKKPDVLLNNKAYFVTLNYDRSLEEFLFRGVCSERYKTPRDQLEMIARDFVKNRIVHLHGHLGPLKWHGGSGTRYAGSPSTMDQIGQMASRLLIATEAVDDQNEYLKAKGWLEKAHRIHFIGYGYHGDQLRRLRPQSVKGEAEDRISGTYHGVDGSHCRGHFKTPLAVVE